MAIRVVVSGTGKMGREVLAALCREPELEPVGVIEYFSSEGRLPLPDGSGSVPLAAQPGPILSQPRPDILVDFTNAEWTPVVAREALEQGVRLVIGTTGLPQGFLAEMEGEIGRASCRERV